MLIIAKIVDCSIRKHLDKKSTQYVDVADISFLVTEPAQPYTATIWAASVAKGEHKVFADCITKGEFLIAVKPEIFNGRLQLSLNTSVKPKLINVKAA